MKSVTAYGKIRRNDSNVEIKVSGRMAFEGLLNEVLLNGRDQCDIVLTVKENQQPKTNSQIRYYFGVVVPFCELGFKALGWQIDRERTDYELRMMFHYDQVVNTTTGEAKKFIASLSKAGKEDMMAFIDLCIMFASQELGVAIPPPDKEYKNVIS